MRTTRAFAWVMVPLVLFGCTNSCSTTPGYPGLDQTAVPSPLLALPDRIEDIAAGERLSYRGIIPGVSRKGDVIAQWGEPNVVRRYESYESLHYFIRPNDYESPAEEYFLLKDDVVQAITSTDTRAWLLCKERAAKLEDLLEVLGEGEAVTPAIGQPLQIWVFPRYGLAVSRIMGDAIGRGDVHIYQFFVPRGLQEYKELWGKYPLGIDPFPMIPSVEKVGIQPGRTPQDQVRRLLGTPDRINLRDAGASWIYYLEPDTQGQVYLYFGANGILNSMHIDNMALQVSQEEAVQEYGIPDTIQLSPDMEGQKYAGQSFLYLRRGLAVTSVCPTLACDLVRRDTRISQKHYFAPTTLEGYRRENPESAFIEWHGFDE